MLIKSILNLFFFFSVIGSTLSFSQSNNQIKKIDSAQCAERLTDLNVTFGANKDIPPEIQLATLVALSYFSELKSTNIHFKKAEIKTSLNAQPKIVSLLFRKKSKRKYVIRYADNDDSTKVLFKNASFNARVGVLAHELNHIMDFSSKNIFGIIGRGLSYASKKKKEKFEKKIDQMTIELGLGWQLYAWAVYILEGDTATEEYKEFKREIYLEPEEIMSALK